MECATNSQLTNWKEPEKDPVEDDNRTDKRPDYRASVSVNPGMDAPDRGSSDKAAGASVVDQADAVPLWSQNPLVNMIAIHFIAAQKLQQQGEKNGDNVATIPGDPQQQATMQSLLKRAQDRMEELGGAKNSSTSASTRAESVGSWTGDNDPGGKNNKRELMGRFTTGTVTTASESHSDSNSNGNSEEDSNLKPPAAKRPRIEGGIEEQCRSGGSGSLSPLGQQPSETGSSNNSQSGVSRHELLIALQQHMDILARRGQVSAVVPSFLNPRMAHFKQGQFLTEEDEEEKQKQHSSTSSTTSITSSIQAVRPLRRVQKNPTRQQYFEDLASEYLSDWVPPIPSVVEVPYVVEVEPKNAPILQQSQECQDSAIASDLSVSVCSAHSEDFGSSSGSSSYLYSTSDSSSQSPASRKVESPDNNRKPRKGPAEGRMVFFALDEDNKNSNRHSKDAPSSCNKEGSTNSQNSVMVKGSSNAESLKK